MCIQIKKGCNRAKVMLTVKMYLEAKLITMIKHHFNSDHQGWVLEIEGEFDNY